MRSRNVYEFELEDLVPAVCHRRANRQAEIKDTRSRTKNQSKNHDSTFSHVK